MRRTVSPVRRHSPVRYIAAPHIGQGESERAALHSGAARIALHSGAAGVSRQSVAAGISCPFGAAARVPSLRLTARVAALKRSRRRVKRRTKTMVEWGPRPAPEPPPLTDAHPDPPL